MDYIFVTFKIAQSQEIELKIPAIITAGQFLEAVQKAFNIDSIEEKCLHVEPLGRILGTDEGFSEEGVYNGSKITLV